ncbi:hypothetical protein LIER_27704 [Lithospermum erythrorhizon]|uniref:Transposon Ty3-I Gag-Pol polyprotein n=1 Tax=Lithospermum erythrorhizon TaxID=34254 RepID=A0AAV3REP5_LITER
MGHVIYPVGIITLEFTVGIGDRTSKIKTQFTVVDIDDPSYNGLIGRPILIALRAIVSPLHLKMKFPTAGGIEEVCGNQKRARICYQASVPPVNKPTVETRKKCCRESQLEIRTVRKEEENDNSPKERQNLKRPIPHEEVEEVPFNPANVERTFKVGTKLDGTYKEALVSLIRDFEDVFAWGPEDMPSVDPEIAIHWLHVESMFIPIKRRKRTFSDEKNMAIRSKVEALLKANAIRELQFPEWNTNVVLVKKSNNKWRMCTNFMSLNKAFPKDFYPLPCLVRLVDGSAGHEVFDFMDASRGYHQVHMLPEDEEKTAFFTEYGIFC